MTMETQTTTLVKIAPSSDLQVMTFYNQALELQKYAEDRVIITNADLLPATNDLSIIARVKKNMESRRKDYLQPFQDHIKETNDEYKALMEPIQKADKITRDKMTGFINEQARKQREAEAIETEKLALAKREAELKGGEIT
ncbi:MAG: hypothetical protein Q8O98_01185, partial [bacterium]|nr:hypothetical protein [bacterium]